MFSPLHNLTEGVQGLCVSPLGFVMRKPKES